MQAAVAAHLHEPRVSLAKNISKNNTLKRDYGAK
jgi:hypothetical protein